MEHTLRGLVVAAGCLAVLVSDVRKGAATETPTATPTDNATATVTGSAAPLSPTVTPTSTTGTATPTSTPPTNTATATANTATASATGTVTVTPTAPPTLTPLSLVATISVGSASGIAGSTTMFQVTLQTTAAVAGTQNDLAFDPHAPVASDSSGNPQCTVNPAIAKGATTFSFEPQPCTPGTTCTAIRALVFAETNLDPIPTGSVLYACMVALASDATGTYPLTCSRARSGDPDANPLGTACTDGAIIVVTATATGTPTVTLASTPTSTGAAPTNTSARSPTSRPGGGPADSDSCRIVAGSPSRPPWVLLGAAALLVVIRRRR